MYSAVANIICSREIILWKTEQTNITIKTFVVIICHAQLFVDFFNCKITLVSVSWWFLFVKMTCKEMIWGGRSNSWEAHGVCWLRWTRSRASNTTSKSKAFILILLFIHLFFFFFVSKAALKHPVTQLSCAKHLFPIRTIVINLQRCDYSAMFYPGLSEEMCS